MSKIISLALIASVAAAAPSAAATLVLAPTDDTLVYSFAPDTSYGDNPGLAGGGVFNGAEQWVSFLRFDLSGIPAGQTVTSATLNLFQFLGGGFAPIGASVYRVANDNWNEAAVTWNSAPVIFGVDLNDNTRISANDNAGTTYRGWSAWDLLASGKWDPATDLADGVLSVAVYSDAFRGTQTHNWCSKESDLTNCLITGIETGPVTGLRRPYLEITAVPLPGAFWLIATCILVLVPRAWRLRRTA
ncbi:MAG: DNRLRE domain-containing protein [Gammaproteobacteria bacterium]|nr:DNRLRE domain-containing protein [Gammaproteobacteria bacterium]